MSWSTIFPILDDDLVMRYQREATREERGDLRHHFEVAEVHGKRSGKHIAAVSLFWKPVWQKQNDYPTQTRELMKDPGKTGIASRFGNPWKHYVEPLLRAGVLLRNERPEVTLRVYLAHDLTFLIDGLVAAGCEVFLMKSSSLRGSPGSLWRFLAMEEENTLVTMLDSDLADTILAHLERTELMAQGGLKYWRVPYQPGPGELNHGNPGWYRTSVGGYSGAAVNLPVSLLCEALLWNLEQKYIANYCSVGSRRIPIWGAKWPDYGFDEFFLNTAIYPRVSKEGILTLLDRENTSQSHWFALDIEYCMKANPASEILHFTKPENLTKKEGKV